MSSNPQPIPHLNPSGTAKGSVPPPPKSMQHANAFLNFFKHVGHVIKDIVVWAPKVGAKTIAVIDEAEKLSPEFNAALKDLITKGALLVAASSSAVAERGTNPLQDAAVMTDLEAFIKSFEAFYPIVITAFNDLDGVAINTPAPTEPVVAPATAPATSELGEKVGEVIAASKPSFTPPPPKKVEETKDEEIHESPKPPVIEDIENLQSHSEVQ